ncbi:MAG: hypothetical protein ACE5KA_09210 [Nitrososphaerales archaeon]
MSKGCGGSDNPDITTEYESRKLFRFVGATKDDVFYDLGCGYGNPCIVAARDLKIKKVVGIEYCRDNYLEAYCRIMEKRLTDRIWLWHKSILEAKLDDATLVYCTLKPNFDIIKHLQRELKKECRLITTNTPLPSIKKSDEFEIKGEKFYVMKAPLEDHKADNPDEWVSSFGYSSFREYYDELEDDRDKRWIRNLMYKIYGKRKVRKALQRVQV